MSNWHIGCSGFHYKHWRGTFYPEKLAIKNWFGYYAEHFDTLELNVTFYRFPRVPMLQKWYEASTPRFRFAVKAPRVITHLKKFNDTERMMEDFYRTVQEGLKEKCGCCLFQLPPILRYTPERLEKILGSLDRSFPNVLEFRHESWWDPAVISELKNRNVGFCGMSHPDLPAEMVTDTPLFYYRFHGKDQLYASRYSQEELQSFAEELRKSTSIQEAYIFFNNDIHTHAIYNAQELVRDLGFPIDKK